MGICGGKEDNSGAEAPNTPLKEDRERSDMSVHAPKGDSGGGNDGASNEQASDFLETLKLNVLLINHRLVTALEFEKEGFAELAAKLKMKNYLDLCSPSSFESVLKEFFDLSSHRPAAPTVKEDNMNYEQEKYLNLISACMDAPWKNPKPNPEAFVDKVQKAAKETQKTLRDSAMQAESSDLKIHLYFFAKALDVCNGDLASNLNSLYDKIDAITEPST